MSMHGTGGARYDEPRVQRILRTITRWCRGNLADIAVYLATALYGVAYGTQHLAGHILVHVWLRSKLVRWMTGMLVALGAGLFLVTLGALWVRWRPLTAADMAPLTGTMAALTRNPSDQRLIIQLADYGSPFLLPASSGPYFNERDFLRDVQPGEHVTIRIDNQLRGYLPHHRLLVAHEIEARGVPYLALQPVQADRRRDIFRTGPLLALAALCMLAGSGVWVHAHDKATVAAHAP